MDNTIETARAAIESISNRDDIRHAHSLVLPLLENDPTLCKPIAAIYAQKLDGLEDLSLTEYLTGSMDGFGRMDQDFADSVADSIGRAWLRLVHAGQFNINQIHTLQAYSITKLGNGGWNPTPDQYHQFIDTFLEGVSINPKALTSSGGMYFVFGLRDCLETRGQTCIEAFERAATNCDDQKILDNLAFFAKGIRDVIALQQAGVDQRHIWRTFGI